MASSYAERAVRIAALLLMPVLAGAQAQLPELDLEGQRSLPITLDADSSEYDRQNERLRFTGLRITQGILGIEADQAEATRLDFENSLWTFEGNVIIQSGDTRAYCDNAEMVFREHQLRSAVLRGQPARFEQKRADQEKTTAGRAQVMEYDMENHIIRMAEQAWLTDGSNEVSGTRITYDLAREFILADADDSGQVRMKINPPEREAP